MNVDLVNTLEAVDMDTGEPVLPVVSTFRDIFEIKEDVLIKRPSVGLQKAKQVDVYLDRAKNLITKYEIVQKEHMQRGHKALYECMAQTYDYALDVFNSPLKVEIIDAMRCRMTNENGKRPSTKTPDMTLIVKYVVGETDRQLAHVYSRALRVAYDEDVPVTSLVSYIEAAGGISKITSSKGEQAKGKLQQKVIAERAELLRRLYVARGKLATSPSFIFNEPVLQWSIKTAKSKKQYEKEPFNETNDFIVVLAVQDEVTGQFRAVECNDFGASYEMGMFRYMAARITTDVDMMKANVQQVERLALGESLEERRERLLKSKEIEKEKRQKQHDENLKKMHKYSNEAAKSSESA